MAQIIKKRQSIFGSNLRTCEAFRRPRIYSSNSVVRNPLISPVPPTKTPEKSFSIVIQSRNN